MKEVCDLDRSAKNYGWCFDCVPEENSLLLGFGDRFIELPSIDLVFDQPRALLGDAVHGRFGDEFPIRFDFLDTMDGGNLSFQVHPLTEYIQQQFGMHYTQDESYYMLDAGPDASVYLGLKEGIDREAMVRDLRVAQDGGAHFDAEKYANKWPAKKHDHFLIPAGTVHCSGANAMVLEISATPYIFTFKMWDWARLGLDGKPRPVHLGHGVANIQWDRTTAWVREEPCERRRTAGERGRVERRADRTASARVHRDTAPLVHGHSAAPHAGRRACAESRRRGGSGRGKSCRCLRTVRGALCRDLHHPCGRRCLYDTSAWPVGGEDLRDDQGICEDLTDERHRRIALHIRSSYGNDRRCTPDPALSRRSARLFLRTRRPTNVRQRPGILCCIPLPVLSREPVKEICIMAWG